MMPGIDLNSTTSRADWFAARALLASRRLRTFVPVGLVVFVLVFITVFSVRRVLAERTAAARRLAERTLVTQRDTAPLVSRVMSARSELAAQDSSLQALLFQAEVRAAAPALSPESQRARDSLRAMLVQLDGALSLATKAPLVASYRALANTRAVRWVGEVQELVDTLDQLDRKRLTLDPAAAPQREFAELTQQSNDIGEKLQIIGREQRAVMVRQISTIEGDAPIRTGRMAVSDVPIAVRLARDSARTRVERAEALLREAREWHAKMQARADSAESAPLTRALGASPIAAAIAALVMAGALIFTLAVTAEARRPTVAHAREAERLAGVPVLGTARPAHLPTEGRARLQHGVGVDPLRMVYLALTASGARGRSVCITGDAPGVVAAVAGRLAVSAAADARATVVVDITPGTQTVARYFGERNEPGFSEAIAAVLLWREVARSVGASEGLGLDVVPPGARRTDTTESVAMASNRSEFMLFTSEYDFTVIAAPTRESVGTVVRLCEKPATIYVARVARTSLAVMAADIRALQRTDLNLHGILLVDSSD